MTTNSQVKSRKNRSRNDTRDKIIDAAEIEFSHHGFESCSLRNISDAYGINLGLIHYYFGGKQGLFSEVFLRRSTTLVKDRRDLLAAALRRSKNKPLSVEEIVTCFIKPSVDMMNAGEGPKAYIRLQVLVRADVSSFARKLRGEAFNTTNNIFIEELKRSCPHLPPTSVVWRFSAMVGAFIHFISQTTRVNELSGGLADAEDIDTAFAELIPFVSVGFGAPPPASGRGKKTAAPAAKKTKRVAKAAG